MNEFNNEIKSENINNINDIIIEEKYKKEQGMRKRKNVAAVLIIVTIISAIIAGIAYSFLYAFSDDKITSDLQPKAIVSAYLKDLKKLDVDKAAKYTIDNTSGFENVKETINSEDKSTAHYNTFYKKMMDYDYKIEDTEINGDKASVKITLETYNFTISVMDARLHITDMTLANKFSGNNESEEVTAQKELAKILDPMKRKLEIPVTITLTKTGDGWRIDNDSIKTSLAPAIESNLNNSIQSYIDYYQEKNKPDGTISLSSFKKYLESKGITYDENSTQSPFDK